MTGSRKVLAKSFLVFAAIILFSLITKADHSVGFTASKDVSQFSLLGQVFSAGAPTYNAACGGEKSVSATEQNKHCWTTTFSLDGTPFRAAHQESVAINPFFNVTPTIFAVYRNDLGKLNVDWKVIYLFSVTNHEFVSIDVIPSQLSQIDAPIQITIHYSNNYGVPIRGGYYVDVFNEKLGNATASQYDEVFAAPTSSTTFFFAPSNLGVNRYSFIPYVIVNTPSDGTNVFSPGNQPAIINVIPNIQNAKKTETACIINANCPEGFSCVKYSDDVKLCTKNIDQEFRTIKISRSRQSNDVQWVWMLLGVIIAVIVFSQLKKD